jgi:tetratricopeptide (TPR) repeat protein
MKMQQIAVLVGAVLFVAGCGNEAKQPTPHQAGVASWNAARSAVMIGLAKDQYDAGQLDKARQTINDALKLSPEDASARVLSARIAIEQSQLELAEKELRLARQFDPKSAEADYLSGVVYERWQKPDLAFDFYSHACEKAPSELAYLLAKAEMLVSMEKPHEALKMLQDRVVFFEHSAAIRDAVGELLVGEKRYTDAVDMLREASILTPDDQGIREHLAMAYFYSHQYGNALESLNRLVTQDKFSHRADLQAAIGECEAELGEYREARAAFESATQLDAGNAAWWVGLAKAALQCTDYQRCEVSLHRAQAIEPQNSQAFLLLGCLRLRQDRLADALVAFNKVSSRDNADALSLCMSGYVLQKLGRKQEALEDYNKALQREPNDPLARQLMAGIDLQQ